MPYDVSQGVVISTIWAIAAETKHSRRQFQEKNCRCAGPWKTDWWKIPRQSCLLSKTWNKPQRCDLWGSGIHHTNCSPVIKIRNATVWGRYHSYKTTRWRRTFIQRQSQSTVMGEEKIAAELMNVEHSKGKTTSGILMWKQSIQSGSSLSKGWVQWNCTTFLPAILLEQRKTASVVGGTASLWIENLSGTFVCRPFAERPTRKNMYTRWDKHSSSCACANTRTHDRTHTHTCTRTHTHTFAPTPPPPHTHTHVHVCACTHVQYRLLSL